MILPRSAAIDGAHEPAELDPDQEHVGVVRVGRDPAHVRGPWARREAPRRSRRQLQKRLQLPPGRTAIVAAKERARFGSGIHSAVDRTYRKREDPRRRQLAVDPTAAAVSGPPDASLAEPGVGDVGIVWIDGEALSAAAAERERDIPRSVALVEARDSVTGRAIQTSHYVTLSATSLAVTWPATPIVRLVDVLAQISIVGAPLAGGPSTPALTAAVCEAGGLGFVAAGYRTPAEVANDIAAVRASTERPFGVNLFVPSQNKVDERALAA